MNRAAYEPGLRSHFDRAAEGFPQIVASSRSGGPAELVQMQDAVDHVCENGVPRPAAEGDRDDGLAVRTMPNGPTYPNDAGRRFEYGSYEPERSGATGQRTSCFSKLN
jgi:hypothetical protein